MIDVIIAAKNEIIGGLVVALLAWGWHKFRVLMKTYKQKKQELERMNDEMLKFGATKEEVKRLQEALSQAESQQQELKRQLEAAQAELQRKDEILSQAEAKAHEDSRLITELRRQIEAQQQELQRKDEALSQAEAKAQEDSKLIEELRRQIEAQQQEKAKKKFPPMSDNGFLELCKSGDKGKIEEAIKNGANVNATDTNDGMTALIRAAFYGQTDIVEVLLEYGADVNAKNYMGRTAVSYASSRGYAETAELLYKYGAK